MEPKTREGSALRLLLVAEGPEQAVRIREIFAGSEICPAVVTCVTEPVEAIREIRTQGYDAALVAFPGDATRGADLVEVLRMAEFGSPVIVLGPCDEHAAHEAVARGADDYLVQEDLRPVCLTGHVKQAITRHRLAAEKERLEAERRQRLAHEKAEADKIIAEQRRIISELEARRRGDPLVGRADRAATPALVVWSRREALVADYSALARSCVVAGPEAVRDRVAEFAQRLAAENVAPTELLEVHVAALEELIAGRSPRMAGHLIARAGTLVLEVLVRLAQQYQHRGPAGFDKPLEILLVTREEETAESIQAVLAQCKLRNSLTIADTAEAACEAWAEAVQMDWPLDLILWDADTLSSEDAPWIEHMVSHPESGRVWHALLCGPGQLPLVPTGLPPLAGRLVKPVGPADVWGLVASLPNYWLSVWRFDEGVPPAG